MSSEVPFLSLIIWKSGHTQVYSAQSRARSVGLDTFCAMGRSYGHKPLDNSSNLTIPWNYDKSTTISSKSITASLCICLCSFYL